MFKKTIIGIVLIVMIVSMTIMPVSAATYNYNDYIVNTGVEGENDIISVSFPTELNKWMAIDQHDTSVSISTYFAVDTASVKTSWFDDCANDMFLLSYKPLGDHVLRVDNVPNGSTLTTNIVVDVSTSKGDAVSLYPYLRIRYYDAKGKSLGRSGVIDSDYAYIGDIGGRVAGTTATVTFNGSTTISKPEGAVYAQFWFYIGVDQFIEPDGNIYTFTLREGGTMTFGISSLYRLQQSTGQTNEILGDINDNIEELPGEIGDEFQDIIDQENQAASDAGDSAAGELVDLLPNESEGFINAIKNLVSSMSYNGTSAKLPIPAITLPAIDGVMPAIKLTDELSCDFGFWIEKLPSDILQLVRILCTIALIVYCFKELYGTISYALTLKGGGNSE